MANKIDSLVEKYKSGIDLSEINCYINMSQDEIFSKTYTQKQELACKLAQYALQIQLLYNEAFSVSKWAEATLKAVLAQSMSNTKGFMYEEKFYLALAVAGAYPKQLEEVRQLATARANTLNFISERLKYMSSVIMPRYGEQKEVKS